MDPFTIMALGSTALTAIGKLGSGFANSQLAQLQSQVHASNTQLLLEKAALEAKGTELAFSSGALDTWRTAAAANRAIGTGVARATVGNLDPTTGSPLLAAGFSASQARTDLNLIGARAQMGAADALQKSAATTANAASENWADVEAKMKSTNDVLTGILGSGAALLSGLSRRTAWAGLGTGS